MNRVLILRRFLTVFQLFCWSLGLFGCLEVDNKASTTCPSNPLSLSISLSLYMPPQPNNTRELKRHNPTTAMDEESAGALVAGEKPTEPLAKDEYSTMGTLFWMLVWMAK